MRALAAFAGFLVVASAVAGNALFPTPLHVVRRIDDPLTKTTVTIDQYCHGNRIVTVNGSRVAIEDFGEQTLTEIDHDRLTYSITRFEDIAKAQLVPAEPSGKTKHTVSVNPSVALSKDAVEALIGAAFPNRRSAQHDDVVRAAGSRRTGRIAAQSTEVFALPTEEAITYENGLTLRNVIVQFNADLPPSSALLIDPGAKRVESRLTRLRRELEELDKLPSQHR